MKKWIVDIHGSLFVEAENEDGAFEAACELIEAARNEKELQAIDEIVSVIRADDETITEDTETK